MSVRIALEPKSLEHVLWYVDQSRPAKGRLAEGEASKEARRYGMGSFEIDTGQGLERFHFI